MKQLHIFRAGSHSNRKGTFSFTEDDVRAIADSYDPALHHAPIVVGHPKTNAPAYGWIKALRADGDQLYAEPQDVSPEFSDLVKEGRFRKISVSLYSPDDAANPTPGKYHLRHVGFLGAQPPAVKGLQPVEFAGDADDALEFEFAEFLDAWSLRYISNLFRGLREWLIESKDTETAERLIPAYALQTIDERAAEIAVEARKETPTFSDSNPQDTQEVPVSKAPTQTTTEAPDAAALAERERQIAEREAQFAEREAQNRASEDKATVAAMITEGRLPQGLAATAEAIFSELGDADLTFSEGDQSVTKSGRSAFRDFLKALPKPVIEREIAAGDGIDFSDARQVQTAIETEIRSAADKGVTLSPAQAAARLHQA